MKSTMPTALHPSSRKYLECNNLRSIFEIKPYERATASFNVDGRPWHRVAEDNP
jgi:hypothetical protein